MRQYCCDAGLERARVVETSYCVPRMPYRFCCDIFVHTGVMNHAPTQEGIFLAQDFTQDMVSSRVENIIREQVGSDASLSPETHLQDDLGMDSLELVELGVTLENEFGVSLPDTDVRRCATIGDVTQLLLHANPEEKVRSV